MLGEKDDDFVTGNADSHVGTACICHSEGDELTHHQVQVKRGEMRGKWAYNELQQIQSFKVHVSVFISEELTQ